MFSVRMRASKKGKIQRSGGESRRATEELHISGAEGLFGRSEIAGIVGEYLQRAMSHSRGEPDAVVLTVERIRQAPKRIGALPVTTIRCRGVQEAKDLFIKFLIAQGVSRKAAESGFGIIYGENAMRGAALVRAKTGRRVDADRSRGVRAKLLGISKKAEKALSDALAREGIDNTTVREALILASKVAFCDGIVAELCISDNPGYTTGYMSSKKTGYIRVPRVKKKGRKNGGRIFFVSESADPDGVLRFLEDTPVLITAFPGCRGTRRIDEIIGNNL